MTGSTWALVGVHEESDWGYVGLQQSKAAAASLVSIQSMEVQDTVQKPPDRVFLIAHFSTWRSPRATRIALSGSHRLTGSNGTKSLAPPCAPHPMRAINNSRPGHAPERLNLVRSRKRSQTLIKEWKYVLVCHMTPPSRRICPLGPYISNLIFWIVCYLYPGWPGGAAGCKVRGQSVGAGLRK